MALGGIGWLSLRIASKASISSTILPDPKVEPEGVSLKDYQFTKEENKACRKAYAYLLDTMHGDIKREDPQSSHHCVKLLFLLQSFSEHENV